MMDPLQPLPFATADLPGIGGSLKEQPEDFEVEEIPAYEPSGQGEFLYLWVEKRAMGAEYFTRRLAERLGLRPGDVGTAGLKDRIAVTRQWVSVPATTESRLPDLDGDGIRVLRVARHSNKLRPGHLWGNRFRILVRHVAPEAGARLGPLVERIQREGMVNFYGPQRFGRGGETAVLGMAMLKGGRPPRSPFLRKLALSAAQSLLFNEYVRRRFEDGLLRLVLPGDVMARWPAGGMFTVTDQAREQKRFDDREIVTTGPIFGRKTFAPAGEAAERERAVLAAAGIEARDLARFGKLLQGSRRMILVYVPDLSAELCANDVQLTVTLPAGSYATVLLHEIMKTPVAPEE